MPSTATRATALVAACLLALSPAARAGLVDDLLVPSQHPTIQGAIEAAVDLDRVLVAPGVYREAIDFRGKDIAVVGIAGPERTVIQAGGEQSTAVTFDEGEPRGALLQGFTVTGGAPADPSRGGGIHISEGAEPTIRDCIVRGNRSLGSGGGLYYSGPECPPSPFCLPVPPPHDGPVIEFCRFLRNEAADDGGGVLASSGSAVHGQIALRDSTIAENRAGADGGGVSAEFVIMDLRRVHVARNVAGGDGGGLHQLNVALVDPVGLVFEENRADGDGGGAFMGVGNLGASLIGAGGISGATYLRNTASRGGGLHARYSADTSLVSRSIFADNVATLGATAGDGARLTTGFDCGHGKACDHTFTLVTDATFVRNSFATPLDRVTVRRTILRGLASPLGHVQVAADGVTVIDSNVEGGWAGDGEGNIDADPAFVDPEADDYHLRADSPCIDRGPAIEAFDFEGDPVDGPADMGADEFAPRLYHVGTVAPGSSASVRVIGPPGAGPVVIAGAAGLAANPSSSRVGPWFLEGPALPGAPFLPGVLPAAGMLRLEIPVPATGAPPAWFLQAAILGPDIVTNVDVLHTTPVE